MAIGTNTFQTYQTIGIREDLIDLIVNISPTENMFQSMTGTVKAKQTYHEWQQDSLASAAVNKHNEGEVASAASATPTVRLGNYCQILSKDLSVSDTNEAVNHAGRKSEIAYQKAKKTKELSNDIELALLNTAAAASGASATEREMKGALAWITTNITSAGAGSASGVNETAFNDNLGLIWAQGGEGPYTALVGSKQKRSISQFTGNNTRFNRIEQAKIQATVESYDSDHGLVKIKKHRVMQSHFPGRVLILGDMGLWRKAWLRQADWELMARTGSFKHWHIESELTLESLQEKGAGQLTGFASA